MASGYPLAILVFMADAQLRNSLLATLAFFDLFDYPLTFAELLRHRYKLEGERSSEAWNASDAMEALKDAAFGQKDGFWFLAGREEIAATRQRRFRLSAKKQARAKRVAAFLRCLPSVRMVAVCNSLAIANADHESDIDLFVVCRTGTLWATRLLVVGALALLGLRPTEQSHADKVCMSFFVSETALDLSCYALEQGDTYLRYWIATLAPVYDHGGTYVRFMNANAWTHDILPGTRPDSVSGSAAEPPRWSAPLLPVLRGLDAAARRLQMRKFPAQIVSMANVDSRVVVSDDVLKFHVGDRRAEFERRFREKLNELGIIREAMVLPASVPELELVRA